jgi:hypothetical protein
MNIECEFNELFSSENQGRTMLLVKFILPIQAEFKASIEYDLRPTNT